MTGAALFESSLVVISNESPVVVVVIVVSASADVPDTVKASVVTVPSKNASLYSKLEVPRSI